MIITQTQVNDYLDCQKYFEFRHIRKLPTPRNPKMIGGAAWHEVVQRYIQSKKPVESQAFADALTRCVRNMFELEQTKTWTTAQEDEVADDLARAAHSPAVKTIIEEFQKAKTLDIEWGGKEFNIDGIAIYGYIDFIADGVAVELKFRWKKEPPLPLDIQLLHYALYLGQGKQDVRFRKIQTIAYKTRVEVVDSGTETISVAAQEQYLSKVLRPLAISINSGVFIPNPKSYKCGEDNCPFFRNCLGS